jgi:hypothetical protein
MFDEELEFNNFVGASIQNADFKAVNSRLMRELASILISHRNDFVDMLNEAGIRADYGMSDSELINLFIDNVSTNQKLILGASVLTNMHNQAMGFDGEAELSDEGVKSCYCVMTSCFTDHYANFEGEDDEEEYSGALGLGSALKKAMKKFNRAKGGGDGGASSEEMKKEAKKEILIEAKRRRQAEAQKKKRTLNTWLIVGGSVVGLSLIGLIMYKMRNK